MHYIRIRFDKSGSGGFQVLCLRHAESMGPYTFLIPIAGGNIPVGYMFLKCIVCGK